jgi:hypothetical protein
MAALLLLFFAAAWAKDAPPAACIPQSPRAISNQGRTGAAAVAEPRLRPDLDGSVRFLAPSAPQAVRLELCDVRFSAPEHGLICDSEQGRVVEIQHVYAAKLNEGGPARCEGPLAIVAFQALVVGDDLPATWVPGDQPPAPKGSAEYSGSTSGAPLAGDDEACYRTPAYWRVSPRCERVRAGDLPNAGIASPARRPQTEEPRPNLRYTTWMPASSLPLEAPAPAEGGEGGEGGEGEAAAP